MEDASVHPANIILQKPTPIISDYLFASQFLFNPLLQSMCVCVHPERKRRQITSGEPVFVFRATHARIPFYVTYRIHLERVQLTSGHIQRMAINRRFAAAFRVHPDLTDA